MRIPIYTARKEKEERDLTLHYAKLDAIKAQKSEFESREIAHKQMINTTQEIATQAMATASSPRMTLNDQLYSGTSGYTNPCTGQNHQRKKQIAKIAYSQSPPAQAMLGRFVDMVYGPSLIVQSMPKWKLLESAPNKTDKDGTPTNDTLRSRQLFSDNAEDRYKLWELDYRSDYYQKTCHVKRSREAFFDKLLEGETISVLRYSQSRKNNPLSVQKIKSKNLMRSGSNVERGNYEVDGIEYNEKSQPVAYHIFDERKGKSERILRHGQRSGRTFVIHSTIGEGHRGDPLLSGIISELTKISDFEALEIQAAVINALFAVWIETEIGGEKQDLATKDGLGATSSQETFRAAWDTSEFKADIDTMGVNSGGIIARPGEGQKIKSFDTKRPTANFEQFSNAVKRNLFSARGMSIAVAQYDFNGSYSAARGELLVFWNRVMQMRFDHINEYEKIIYQMWMWGEIDNGNIERYDWYKSDLAKQAMSFAKFTGPQRPDIDPLVSAKAHKMESDELWKTDNHIAAERGGGDWNDNAVKKISENKIKAAANEPLVVQKNTTYSNSKTESKSEVVE